MRSTPTASSFLLMVLVGATALEAGPVRSIHLVLPAKPSPVIERIAGVFARQVAQRCEAKVVIASGGRPRVWNFLSSLASAPRASGLWTARMVRFASWETTSLDCSTAWASCFAPADMTKADGLPARGVARRCRSARSAASTSPRTSTTSMRRPRPKRSSAMWKTSDCGGSTR